MTYLFLKKKFGPGKSTIYRLKVIYTIESLQLLPVKKKKSIHLKPNPMHNFKQHSVLILNSKEVSSEFLCDIVRYSI